MMHEHRQSDDGIVPAKSPNKPGQLGAEEMEGRPSAKGNELQSTMPRTQGRENGMSVTLERIRLAVKRDKGKRLTALYHHIYAVGHLEEAYWRLRRDAAPGIDGETWQAYGENLQVNLQDLSARLRRGAYRATPVRRVYIPKADGRSRPLGIPALEDKIVQSVTAQICSAIWEEEFLGFSYGFRLGRSAHWALDALAVGIERKCVRWVLDADIRGFYDTISHEWLVKFVEHRIGDKRVIRLIQKWLKAGVLEAGEWKPSEEGTPQGGLISPILANIYLHYAFDLWLQQWRTRQARGDVIVVRYADDFVVGFEHRGEALRFQRELTERLKKFNLELHAEKTRLIEFGRYAEHNRAERGAEKPETFNFLGFTHSCSWNRRKSYTVRRQTMRKCMQAKLKDIKVELKRRMHAPIPEQGQWLRSVLLGHYQYYGVPMNGRMLYNFRYQILGLWKQTLGRRSQTGNVTWERMYRLEAKWLPVPRICQPYPGERIGVTTQGKSRMR
jgi:RNA-directed DNA polymerase